jgi:predicted alpha/beta superfamily hydrolase
MTFALSAFANDADISSTRPSTRTGDIRLHPIHSKLLNNDRNLWVWLPPDYEKEPDRKFAVFYLHDAQNLFDSATSFAGEWRADETADELIRRGAIEPVILVGIDNNVHRTAELTPTADPREKQGGRGDLYAKFVIEEVKPFIDATYRTTSDRKKTAIGGASLGGLISLYIAQKDPKSFGCCAAISPSLWWNYRGAFKDLAQDARWMKQTKFWLDIGTEEGKTPANQAKSVEDLKNFAELLEFSGLTPETDFKLRVFEHAKHNETAWAARFDQVLFFFFGK